LKSSVRLSIVRATLGKKVVTRISVLGDYVGVKPVSLAQPSAVMLAYSLFLFLVRINLC
jgi:hypothetical protein